MHFSVVKICLCIWIKKGLENRDHGRAVHAMKEEVWAFGGQLIIYLVNIIITIIIPISGLGNGGACT